MSNKTQKSFTLVLGEDRAIRHESIAPRDDPVRAIRAVDEDDVRAMTLDWPDLDQALHRASFYTAGLLLPGRDHPLLVEVIMASHGAYRRAVGNDLPEDECSAEAARAMARSLSLIISRMEVSVHDGVAWWRWSPPKSHLTDHLKKSRVRKVRVDPVGHDPEVPRRDPFADRLIIASRIFDLPLLERAGFLSSRHCDESQEPMKEAAAG